MDDCQIVELYFARDEQAVRATDEKYGRLCRSIARSLLPDPEDSEECVNDAYLGVWNTIPPQRPDPLLSYVCRIVRNLALKKYHENTAQKRNSYYDAALDEIADCIPASYSVEDEVLVKDLANAINGFLETLDPQSRIMFIRRYWHADSVEEIAALFHKSNHYISVRLSRIRKALKQHLGKEELLP